MTTSICISIFAVFVVSLWDHSALTRGAEEGSEIVVYTALLPANWDVYLIESASIDGSDQRAESDNGRDYWAPFFDSRGRIVCHGLGLLDEKVRVFNSGTPGPFLIVDQPGALPDRRLSVSAVLGYFPAINSKTGEVATDEGFDRVVITRLDGSGLREGFKPKSGLAWRPTWSKDGRWLACTAGPTFAEPNSRADIWKFRPDGTGAVNLTPDSPANDAFPDFSPDGRQLVFRSGRDGNHEIYLMNSDGTEPQRLTNHSTTDTMPAFLPGGNQIVSTSNRGGDYEIYLLNLRSDGSTGEPRRMTNSPGRDTHPKFSPDGKWLVFSSERGGMNDETPLIPIFNPQPYGEIYALRIADGEVVRLTHNKWEEGTPAWGVRPGKPTTGADK